MHIKDLIIDGTKCELCTNLNGDFYLDSNFSYLQGLLKKYKWVDTTSYGCCYLDITTLEQLNLILPIINEICNTTFSLEFVKIQPSSLRHKNDNIQDILFKDNNKIIYKVRLTLNEQNEYPDESMKQREQELVKKISSILYWIFCKKEEI